VERHHAKRNDRPENRKSGWNPLRPLEPHKQGCGGCQVPRWGALSGCLTERVWEGKPLPFGHVMSDLADGRRSVTRQYIGE